MDDGMDGEGSYRFTRDEVSCFFRGFGRILKRFFFLSMSNAR